MTTQYTAVKPSEVRTFARENGLTVGTRGKFSDEVTKRFNKGRKGPKRYDPSVPYAPHVTCVGKVKGRPPVRKTVAVPVLREEAAKHGVNIGARGRISEQVKVAYATGDWSALTAQESQDSE